MTKALSPFFPKGLKPDLTRSLALQFTLQSFLQTLEWEKALLSEIVILPNFFRKPSNYLNKLLFKQTKPLDAICFYSEILLKTAKSPEGKNLINPIYKITHRMRDIKNTIAFFPQKRFSIARFRELHSSIKQELSFFWEALFPFFQESKKDENVWAFLIENRAKFHTLFQTFCIEKLIKTLFPGGKQELCSLLFSRYFQRGFVEAWGKLEPLIEELKWNDNTKSEKSS